jgi:two-component sensor histidine kinase
MFVEWVRIITKRKEAEIELDSQRSFLSAVLDSLEEAIIICDGEGRIVRFNEAARRVHGLPEKPIPPEQWAEYYDLYQVDGVTPLPMKDIPLYRALTGTNVANQELIVVRSDRDPCHFVCNGKAITAGGGNIIGAVIAMHDITSLKEAEKDLQISLEEKEFLMQELGHRVKNNLMMVSSLISLKDSALGGRADLTDIKRQVEAILLLHEKLDGMERVNNIDFGKYVEELVENLFSFSRKPVKLEIDITDILLPTKQAVPLGLIVNEIATNAVKHGLTDEEEAKFSVSLREVPAAGECILTLSNNGKPFPEGIDLENPSTLGLRLVSALVSQLNGTVELTRAPHPVFTIQFPMGKQE